MTKKRVLTAHWSFDATSISTFRLEFFCFMVMDKKHGK